MVRSHVPSDQQLVNNFKKGDEQGLVVLLHRYKAKIYSSIFFLVRDKELAEDIFQETFFKIIISLRNGSYNHQGKFVHWAIRIGHNLVIDHLRAEVKMKKVRSTDTMDIFNLIPCTEKNSEQLNMLNDRDTKVRALIELIPFEQREVLIMRHYAGMSFKDISKSLNININTALGRMRYALIAIRKIIEEKRIELY